MVFIFKIESFVATIGISGSSDKDKSSFSAEFVSLMLDLATQYKNHFERI